jgi:ankyrin repeat protein
MNKLAKKLVFGKNNLGQTCFHIAAAFGYRTILNHLLEHPDSLFDPDYLITDRDNKLNTAFHLACLKNQEKIVRTLLKFNLNFNEKNSDFLSAIDICCKNGYFELTKLILEQNPLKRSVNINSDHDNIDHPLKLACESGNALLLKYLINNGANLNFKNRSQDNVNLLGK